MTKVKIFLCALTCILLTNCETEERFPLNKRYWDIEDYEAAVNELKFGYDSDEQLPTFDNPETRLIVEKLTDEQNFIVVLEDKELGMRYKNQVAEAFFERWRLLIDVYDKLDRKDMYIYDEEMLAVYQFGLGLQLRYFELGNEQIRANADDPNAASVNSTINANVRTLISNYINYLDYVNEESRLSEAGQKMYAEGISTYFTTLVNRYPDSDFSNLQRKVNLMLQKTKVAAIETALTELKELIFEKINLKKKEEESSN